MNYPKTISQRQFLNTLENVRAGEVMAFNDLNLTNVDFQDPKIRTMMMRICDHNRNAPDSGIVVLNFTNSLMTSRFLSDLDLTHCIFTGVNAEHAVFINSNLSDVSFEEANLNNADMRYTTLNYTKFYGASIQNVNFTGANLSTAYGLNLQAEGEPETAIERLKVVHSISDAKLPESLEAMRETLEKAIQSHSE